MLELFQPVCVENFTAARCSQVRIVKKLCQGDTSAGASRLRRTAGSHMLHRSMRIENRHRKMKMRAFANFALHPDPPAVRFNQVFGDRQTEPRPARLTRSRRVDAVKSLKNPRL